MERVSSLHSFATELLFWANKLNYIARSSSHKIRSETGRSDYEAKIDDLLTQKSSLPKEDWTQFISVDVGRFHDVMMRLENAHAGESRYIEEGFSSLMFSMVSGSYAAFETFASDLWLNAVSLDARLARNVIANASNKSIKLGKLLESRYDPKTQAGHFLKEQGSVNLQTLEGLRDAYEDALGEKIAPLRSNPGIIRASKVRNLIAHRAGLVDSIFKSEMGKFQEFEGCRVGEYLTMAGPMVCSLIDSCVKTAIELALFVDGRMHADGTVPNTRS